MLPDPPAIPTLQDASSGRPKPRRDPRRAFVAVATTCLGIVLLVFSAAYWFENGHASPAGVDPRPPEPRPVAPSDAAVQKEIEAQKALLLDGDKSTDASKRLDSYRHGVLTAGGSVKLFQGQYPFESEALALKAGELAGERHRKEETADGSTYGQGVVAIQNQADKSWHFFILAVTYPPLGEVGA